MSAKSSLNMSSNQVKTITQSNQILLLKIELKNGEIETLPNFERLSPYIELKADRQIFRTGSNANSNGNRPEFNEVFIFKEITSQLLKLTLYHKMGFLQQDKLIGECNVNISDPTISSIQQLKFKSSNGRCIASLNVKLTAIYGPKTPTGAKEELKRRVQTESGFNLLISNQISTNPSLDLTNDLVSRMHTTHLSMSRLPINKQKLPYFGNSQSTDITSIHKIPKTTLNSISNTSGISFLKKKPSDSEFEDVYANKSSSNALQLEDAEKIKFDLNEEKKNIRMQEIYVEKMLRKWRQKEAHIEEQHNALKQKKESLTQEELNLLEQRRQWETEIRQFKSKKEIIGSQKLAIIQEIDTIRQNAILSRNRNIVIQDKLKKMITQLDDISRKKEYFQNQLDDNDTSSKMSNRFNNTTATFFGRGEMETDHANVSHINTCGLVLAPAESNRGCWSSHFQNKTEVDSAIQQPNANFSMDQSFRRPVNLDSECDVEDDERFEKTLSAKRLEQEFISATKELKASRISFTNETSVALDYKQLALTKSPNVSAASARKLNSELVQGNSNYQLPSFGNPDHGSTASKNRASFLTCSIVSEVNAEQAVSTRMRDSKQYVYKATLECKN